MLGSSGRKVAKVAVNESGASIYSASEAARAEFPDLDLTVRGAISIARRLQDPLAELVKVDAKSIGVGQYQHDVNQAKLRKALDREVESCVNLVGVDLNTASGQLLSYVSGIGPKLADSILQHRNAHGAFSSREELLSVPRLGGKAFQQSAGFLRVRGGRQPLDNSAVHPESYYLVEKMAQAAAPTPQSLIGNTAAIQRLDPRQFVDDRAGLPTVEDILRELEKPGRDPRQEFRVPQFAEGVRELADLPRGDGFGRRGDERHAIRGLCGHRRSPGRADPHLRVGQPLHQGPERSGGRRRHRPREGPAGGHRTPADRTLAKTGRLLMAVSSRPHPSSPLPPGEG